MGAAWSCYIKIRYMYIDAKLGMGIFPGHYDKCENKLGVQY